jgi:hypothetical protein
MNQKLKIKNKCLINKLELYIKDKKEITLHKI